MSLPSQLLGRIKTIASNVIVSLWKIKASIFRHVLEKPKRTWYTMCFNCCCSNLAWCLSPYPHWFPAVIVGCEDSNRYTLPFLGPPARTGVLVVRWPLDGLIVTSAWIVSGAFVPYRGLEPWLPSTVHIITLTAAWASQSPPPVRLSQSQWARCMGGVLDWRIKLDLLDASSHA